MASVKKIGNSLWVLIPATIAKESGLSEGVAVSVVSAPNGVAIRKKMTPLTAVWVSANTSYKNGPTIEDVKQMFASGELVPQFAVHINHILTEAPMSVIVSAALEAAGDPALALANIKKLEASVAAH